MRIDRVKFVTGLARANLNVKQLAELSGVSRVTISSIKAGKSCSRDTANKAWLDSKNVRYNLMLTDYGKHFYFRVPANYPYDANKVNWYTALGIRVEVKLGGGTSKEHIPFRVGGVLRQWVVGSMENEDIDNLPAELWPLQKSRI